MLLADVEFSFSNAADRIRVLATADFDTFRGVGRKQLPTSIGGALIHVADHTQRHIGQVVTTAKVLKALAGHGLVTSTRGARGGYRLGRPLSEIAVAEVIMAIDGPIALTSCVYGGSACESQSLCPVAGRWDPVNDAIRDALTGITLADMAAAAVPRAFRIPVTMNEVA